MEYTEDSCFHRGCFVYYEFYIDQFFVEHLLTGYLLLRMTAKRQRADVKTIRVLAGSFADTIIMTLCICTGIFWCRFLGMFFAGTILFAGKGKRQYISGMTSLALVSVTFGGALQILTRIWGIPLLLGVLLTVLLLERAGTYWDKQKWEILNRTEVQIALGGKTVAITGMVDTGNQLREPLTGRPVSIVEETAVETLLEKDWERKIGFCLIPYHSLGKDKGWMRGVTMDRMIVGRGDGRIIISDPVLALYTGKVSAGENYQIILHPQHAVTEK